MCQSHHLPGTSFMGSNLLIPSQQILHPNPYRSSQWMLPGWPRDESTCPYIPLIPPSFTRNLCYFDLENVEVRILQRNRTSRMWVHIQRKRNHSWQRIILRDYRGWEVPRSEAGKAGDPGELMFLCESKGWKSPGSQLLHSGRRRSLSLSLVLLSIQVFNWLGETHIEEGHLLCSVSWFKCSSLSSCCIAQGTITNNLW